MFKSKVFTGKCPICGKEMSQPAWGPGEFHDVCGKCFDTRFWDIIEEDNKAGLKYIIDGAVYTAGFKGGFGGKRFSVQLLENHPNYKPGIDNIICFPGNLCYNGEVPEDRKSELPDNAKFIWRT